MKTISWMLTLSSLLALIACGGETSGDSTATEDASPAQTSPDAAAPAENQPLAGVLLSEKPSGAITITHAKQEDLAVGADVVIRGRIGGRADPFVAERAVFSLADDEAIMACDANPDDACAKPWDFCCVPQSDIAAAVASIQVVDATGAVLKADLDSLEGLDPGAHVVVAGTIAEGSDDKVLIVTADGIYVDRERHAQVLGE